jgi:hypothetical protein
VGFFRLRGGKPLHWAWWLPLLWLLRLRLQPPGLLLAVSHGRGYSNTI